MNAAGLAVAAGWEVASIHSNIKGVKWSSNLTALEAAGGRHLTLKQYHNGGTDWKNAHPEGRIQGNKAPWPEQWVECLVDLELKEEVMCANVTAKRDIVDETAYSTVFAKQIFDEVKTNFYELGAGTVDWDDDVRERISAQWVNMLRQRTGLRRQ